jgi:hypothetical protein
MGTVLNVFQYGIIVNQSYLYYVWYKRYGIELSPANKMYLVYLPQR